MGPLPSSKGHSGRWSSCGRSTASTPTKLVLSLSPSAPHSPVSTPSCLTPSPAFSSRIVRSSTWCSRTRSTSGSPVRQERSAPSSRFSITLVSATARHGSQSSSTASPSCWEVRPSRLTQLTQLMLSAAAAVRSVLGDSAMPDSLPSQCAVSQSVPGDTWYTRGSMNITQAVRQPSAGQCNTSCSPRIYIADFKTQTAANY